MNKVGLYILQCFMAYTMLYDTVWEFIKYICLNGCVGFITVVKGLYEIYFDIGKWIILYTKVTMGKKTNKKKNHGIFKTINLLEKQTSCREIRCIWLYFKYIYQCIA